MQQQAARRLVLAMRKAMRLKGYGIRTERAYIAWIEHYLSFHDFADPACLEKHELIAFLNHLSINESTPVDASQEAVCALNFFHQSVLNRTSMLTPVVEARPRHLRQTDRFSAFKAPKREGPASTKSDSSD